jgi:predicted small lipoprotein YifL
MKKQARILGSIAKPHGFRQRHRLGTCLLLTSFLLSACGQKGALYLPAPTQGASSASTATKAPTP